MHLARAGGSVAATATPLLLAAPPPHTPGQQQPPFCCAGMRAASCLSTTHKAASRPSCLLLNEHLARSLRAGEGSPALLLLTVHGSQAAAQLQGASETAIF